eukprot:CAMPEP_0181214666 /NCGR_PEP_ID=MMETSP1096-20121128/25585_1 /TAXON_ID=156174 ORGANISM="Chrysochromulina ericina, Strain CCMP281" /NCGR_SAMPLE_ID=MMETSP1096 /ASSEMBLY_ACC=CAM_ASM_000453 /LENGTH=48 /DNA_ID= /DNA_START= /DNA_END= /DNA_ORIENTATION=
MPHPCRFDAVRRGMWRHAGEMEPLWLRDEARWQPVAPSLQTYCKTMLD